MSIAKTNSTKYKRSKLVSEKIGGKEIVLNHQKGTIISLNSTASEILVCLKSPKTISQIFEILDKKYIKVSTGDIKSSIKELELSGIIHKCI